MTRQEILFNGARVICVSILSKRKKIHMKCRKYISKPGQIVGVSKGCQILVKFDHRKNPVAIPLSCLHIVTES